mmetsp:Transcript_9466/g.14195  ORF Transcript_9466/g.14195 Transcript_9466/m.14195 type:complete len:160 (+) Transcript_9466:89-568(+)|eukprot:CAMPEP_0167747690 /NCGR_PEP_ID=MMETSP0110_2-20121227/4421_1 /TAXON_ID=629695 /ORGANISM="Gymnochlora sp., Strain CCMP2014" /LENGTH=159 /DNA_ID=CAMNT_0007632619 /DNA_START=27 /DNA_END=506 /DNA_ORIENTATION=+
MALCSKSNALLAGYALMLFSGIGFVISCWMATSATSSSREGFLMIWNSLMMAVTLFQMLYWRICYPDSNLMVGITISMMGFMSLQAVLAGATYVNTESDHGYDEALASFSIIYAIFTISHIALMALWRHGTGEEIESSDQKDALVSSRKSKAGASTSSV